MRIPGRPQIGRMCIIVLALIWLGGCGQALPPETTLRVVATEMEFTPAMLEVKQGAMVTIRLVNAGQEPHNLILEMTSTTREVAATAGVDALLTFPARDVGTFRFYCSIPGHEAMVGELTIVP